MLTLDEAEKRHERIKADLRRLRRAMRTSDDIEGIAEEVGNLKNEAKALYDAIHRHQRIAAYLMRAKCYGGAH